MTTDVPFDSRLAGPFGDTKAAGPAGDTGEIIAFTPPGGAPRFVPGEQEVVEVKTPAIEILDSAAFCARHEPLNYLVDGILLEGFFYSLTAPTGHGKTVVALELARVCMFGGNFGGFEIERKGRVLYLIGENFVDTRMRYFASAKHFGFDPDTAPIDWVECSFGIAEHIETLRRRADATGGYTLVVVDGSTAFFRGDDENNNKQMQNHARIQRQLCGLPGHPTVVTLCHPVKNAGKDNLGPRGGGAFVNEVDGNLTLWKDAADVFTFHHQVKFRGPEFPEIKFQIQVVMDERNVTSKSKPVPSIVAVALDDSDAEHMAERQLKDEDLLLTVMENERKASIAALAISCGWTLESGEPHKTKVARNLRSLKKDGLTEQRRSGKWAITDKGKKEASAAGRAAG